MYGPYRDTARRTPTALGSKAAARRIVPNKIGLLGTGLLILCSGLFPTEKARAQDVSTPVVHITDEQNRIMSGKLTPAAETISHANALYARALNPGLESDPQETLARLREVILLDPHFTTAQIKIGDILIRSGRVEAALEQLQTALTANPGSAGIEAMLGYAQRLHGENSEALRLSQDALAKDINQTVAMRVMLEIASDQNDLAGGVIHIEDILKNGGPTITSSPWLALAKLYIEIARADLHTPPGDVMLKTLLPIYQQAAAKRPPSVDTLILLSDTYRDLGQKREALKIFKQAGALEPSNVDIILRCADLETDLGQKIEALKDYEQAYALNPSLTGLRETLVRLYLEHDRFDDAAEILQQALADMPHDPGLEVDLGIAYEGAHQHEKAEACFQHAFAAPTCNTETYLRLAVFYLMRRELTHAGEILNAAQTRFPKSAKIRFYQAIKYRYQKNYPAALDCLTQIRNLTADHAADTLDINYYLENALTLNLAGKQDQIESTLREGLTKYPANPDLMNELAYFWADRQDHLSEALTLSKHAVALSPDSGAIQDTCGWVYFKMGRTKDALPYLQRAALLTDNDPVVLQHLGDAYLKLGRRREAIAAWRSALEKDHGNHDLTNRIDAALAQATNAHTRSAPSK